LEQLPGKKKRRELLKLGRAVKTSKTKGNRKQPMWDTEAKIDKKLTRRIGRAGVPRPC